MADDVVTQPVDPEPEGVIEIDKPQGTKEKVVPLAALTAERERIRTAEREKHAKELEPLRAKAAQADQLSADLQALQPQLEHLKRHPELLQADQPPAVQAVSDEDAEKYARRYELFTATGLDLTRAKQIIADNRQEITRVAKEAAAEAIKPVAQQTALDRSKANFTAAYYATDAAGRQLVDPEVLTQQWRLVPVELSADPEVAQLILDRAIGIQHRMGRQSPPAPTQEPVFSEASGGRQPTYQISEMERNMARTLGMSEAEWSKSAKNFKPGAINVLGE